jgi:hypothetical protein
MSISVDWGDAEETIIVWKFEQGWTRGDYYRAYHHFCKLIKQSNQVVNVIADVRRALPAPGSSLSILRHAIINRHSQVERVAVITVSTFPQQLFALVHRQLPGDWFDKYQFTDSVDEAYEWVKTEAEYPIVN